MNTTPATASTARRKKAVRWLSCYVKSDLAAAVGWETTHPERHVAAEVLAHGRSVVLREVDRALIGLQFEVERYEWACTRDAYSGVNDDGSLSVAAYRRKFLVPVEHFSRVWAALVRECARTGRTLLHSEVSLGVDRKPVAVTYRHGNPKAEGMARTVGHWLSLPIVAIRPWRD